MVRAAPSGLRFWLTVDQRTNDTLSVLAVCETCCSNTCCEALWLNCNRISFNRSKNTTQSPPIHRRQRHFVLTVKGPRWPKISIGLWPTNYLIRFSSIFVMTLTFNFQGQIWNLLCLSQKWSNCHETKGKYMDWILGLKCYHWIWQEFS